jgi:hypothetical protein
MRTTQRRRPATPTESARAMTDLQRLFHVTPRMRAQERFDVAKAELDAATRGLMEREPGSIERADTAMRELNEARAALALLDEGAQR